MNIDIIFKIAAVGIIVSVVNAVLKKSDREEQAMLVTLAGLVIVLMMMINEIAILFETVKSIFNF